MAASFAHKCSIVVFFATSLLEKTTMVLAIARKELRETRLFVALAAGVYFVYLIKFAGKWSRPLLYLFNWLPGLNAEGVDVPFVEDGFLTVFFFTAAPLAIALGLRQSAWEPSQGTTLYLLHLPLGRRAIYLTKLLTGIVLLLTCTILPILIYGSWASLPGTHAGPFEWSMAGPAIHLWLLMPLVYLGAFSSGIRPARWFGSRLLPLSSTAIPAILLYLVPHWWLIGFPLVLFTSAALVSDILLTAETRDY